MCRAAKRDATGSLQGKDDSLFRSLDQANNRAGAGQVFFMLLIHGNKSDGI